MNKPAFDKEKLAEQLRIINEAQDFMMPYLKMSPLVSEDRHMRFQRVKHSFSFSDQEVIKLSIPDLVDRHLSDIASVLVLHQDNSALFPDLVQISGLQERLGRFPTNDDDFSIYRGKCYLDISIWTRRIVDGITTHFVNIDSDINIELNKNL